MKTVELCPRCAEPLTGLDADGNPCPDCEQFQMCHSCHWKKGDREAPVWRAVTEVLLSNGEPKDVERLDEEVEKLVRERDALLDALEWMVEEATSSPRPYGGSFEALEAAKAAIAAAKGGAK